jgi:ABC-type transporter Mla subunit MlaD
MIGWLSILALLVSMVALAYAWRLQQELGSVTRRLDRYNKALFDASDELRRLREEAAATSAQLRAEIKRNRGGLLFEPSMTVREAQMLHPQVQQIMAGLHLGGCSSCAVDPDETLAQACADQGRDVTQVVDQLNRLLHPVAGNGHAPVKIPNVELNV